MASRARVRRNDSRAKGRRLREERVAAEVVVEPVKKKVTKKTSKK